MQIVVRLFGVLVLACLLAGVQERAGEAPPAEAAFPGDNGKIAFISVRDAGQGIYVSDPDSPGVSKMPTGSLLPDEVEWSADGQRVAFTTNNNQIFVMDADGNNLVPITNAPEFADHPTWSPDGTKIAFQGGDAIWVANANGTGGRVKIAGGEAGEDKYANTPEWSPDGSKVAYLGNFRGIQAELFTVSPNGGTPTQLTNSDPHYGDLSWSPDGTRIATSDFRDIIVLTAAGAFVRKLTNDGCSTEPAWSPDGSKIAFKHTCGGQADIFVMNADGSGTPQNVTNDAFFDFSPDWRPLPSIVHGVEFTQAIQQLQSLSALQSDLQSDGKPPVPMIEGKSAAMRIYFAEVDQATDYSVEVSGAFSDNEIVNLTPGCTPTQRRAQTGGCSSVDFFFTPPTGNWSVRLVVKDILNQVVLDEEFDLTSLYMGEFNVQYLPICVTLPGDFLPTCPTSFVENDAAGLMRKLLPIADADFHYTRLPVPAILLAAPVPNYTGATNLLADLQLRYDLMALGNLAPDQIAGWMPAGGNTGSPVLAGISHPLWFSGQGHVSWQMDTSASDSLDVQHTLFHEIAHNLGRRHTSKVKAGSDSCGAVDSGTDWPYANSTIQEVGFDVAAGTAVPASKFDILSYCSPPGTNVWISPHTYTKLVDGVFVPMGSGVSPAGAPVQQLVLKGNAQADGSAATIDSAYVITTSTQATPPNPIGNYCLRTSGGASLDYCFQLNFTEHQSGAAVESESFSLRMPLPEGTTHVSLAKGFLELDALDLSPSPPSLDVTQPDELSGEGTISWSASDADSDPLKFAVMYTPDDGQTWYPIAVDLTEPAFTFDSSVLDGDEILIRVLASDGLHTTVDTTGPVTVIQGTERTWGDNNCSGAVDPVDSLLTLRFDSGQNAATGACPAFGQQVEVPGGANFPWGDIDCSGDVAPVDALKLLRFDAGLSAAQGPGCPPLGAGVVIAALPGGAVADVMSGRRNSH
ncbi:MAG TPA: hypothetical protein VMR52_08665 [Dehalococcoidia bacterium]|nr:hypothetical protein [Dehalococcoidia bacterium]